ncbi:MAG: hypothetical protein KAG18_04895 [Sinobacterium sp.]|nr:hypothetical protein [Sinobacterium sp.]
MLTLSAITEVLGWASLLNIAFLMFTTLSMILMKNSISLIHSKLFGINEKDLPKIYFSYLANYKILSLVFFIAPYISLKIMGH